MMRPSGYFKVPTALLPNRADAFFPFVASDMTSVSRAWSAASELRQQVKGRAIVQWGDVRVSGPWDGCIRVGQ